MAKQINWMSEKEVASLLKCKPRTFRNKVKSGKVPVTYRTVEGRNFQYDEAGVKKYQEIYTIYR